MKLLWSSSCQVKHMNPGKLRYTPSKGLRYKTWKIWPLEIDYIYSMWYNYLYMLYIYLLLYLYICKIVVYKYLWMHPDLVVYENKNWRMFDVLFFSKYIMFIFFISVEGITILSHPYITFSIFQILLFVNPCMKWWWWLSVFNISIWWWPVCQCVDCMKWCLIISFYFLVQYMTIDITIFFRYQLEIICFVSLLTLGLSKLICLKKFYFGFINLLVLCVPV